MVTGVDIVAVVDSARNVRPGDVVTLHISLDKIHLFDATNRGVAAPEPDAGRELTPPQADEAAT